MPALDISQRMSDAGIGHINKRQTHDKFCCSPSTLDKGRIRKVVVHLKESRMRLDFPGRSKIQVPEAAAN